MKPQKLFALLLIISGFISLWFLKEESPFIRLVAVCLGLLFVIKVAAVFWQYPEKKANGLGLFLFLFIWPGTSLKGFERQLPKPPPNTGKYFMEAWVTAIFGCILFFTAIFIPIGNPTITNYLLLISVLFLFHLGFLEILANGIRLLGFSPKSLFMQPYNAVSLRDFWSNRWNGAFVDMNKIFILQPLKNKMPAGVLLFTIFLISGLLHELGISYADGISWGYPLLYFTIQGVGVLLEKKIPIPRILVYLWLLLPAPLLFTPNFVNLFFGELHNLIITNTQTVTLNDFLSTALKLGAILHLIVLCASAQVPKKLNWKEEFAKLQPLNRKVFWTYGIYIFSIILFFAFVSLRLSFNAWNSTGADLWLIFIALFWWLRLIFDFFYLKHSDWPQGPLFKIGHICLTTVFLVLAILYTSLYVLIPNR